MDQDSFQPAALSIPAGAAVDALRFGRPLSAAPID
jgi:hypothetical protein